MKLCALALAAALTMIPAVLTVIAVLEPLTPLQLIAYAAIVSAMSGWAAGWRVSDHWAVWLKTALNTAMMGVVLVLGSAYWTLQDPLAAWTAVGVSGAVALGGLAGVEWAWELFRRKAESKFNEHDERNPPPEV